MKRYNVMRDAEGAEYAVELHRLACGDDTCVARLINPDGSVGPPFLLPEVLLNSKGAVYLRENRNTWLAVDHRPRPVPLATAVAMTNSATEAESATEIEDQPQRRCRRAV